ncbi:MAG: DUF6531 domain-containing protein [Pseudomonadaceae bacterium]|nr:DUF6531 domain-containing protein [Pseudomonadaceae bacterium]
MHDGKPVWLFVAAAVSLFLTLPSEARRSESLKDVPLAVTVLSECDLEDVTRSADLIDVLTLPGTDGSCLVSWPSGRADDAFTVRGFDQIQAWRDPVYEVISQGLNTIPGCYGAQQEDENADSSVSEDEVAQYFDQAFASGVNAAKADVSEKVGVLARPPAAMSPEQLIQGTVAQWSEADSKGPVYYLVAGGGFPIEVVSTRGTTSQSGDTVSIPSDAIGDTVIVEEIDECTTRTTVVRAGGSTGTRGGGQGEEEDEDIHLFPGGSIPPFAPPGEEEDDEEEPLYCTIRDSEILTPVTREYLSAENEQEPAVSRHSPAMGGVNLQLGSGRLLRQETDLHVKSLGHDFVLERTYAGHMLTEKGGNLGHRWQLNYDRRITVLSATEEREGLKVEPLFGASRLSYADGYGRLDTYEAISKEVHTVQNFGAPQPFKAHITTYASPPGAMHELQRYVVVRASGELGLKPDPENHPFKTHSDVDTKNGEALFYVLRTPEHEQYVFNCRGQNIVIRDRFGHDTTLNHGGAINPLTHNPVLTKISDASKREYVFKAERSQECAPFLTWHKGGVKSNACAPVPLFTEVMDPWGRSVGFGHTAKSELATITRTMGTYVGESGFSYVDSGTSANLMHTAWEPEQGRTKPYLTVSYSNGRVSSQNHGGFNYTVGYPGKTTTVVTNPNGASVRYELDKLVSGTVAKSVARTADNTTLTTRFSHNVAGQVTTIVHPRGNQTRYAYYGRGQPVAIPQAPMQNLLDLKITYRNPLSEGMLRSITRVSHLPDDNVDQVSETFSYEPLYNQLSKHVDGRGNATTYAFRYDLPGAYGRATSVRLPDRTDAQGDVLKNIVLSYRYDRDGHRLEEADMLGNKTSYGVDKLGEIVSITDAVGAKQAFGRDDRGNLLEEVRPSGLRLRYSVDLRDLPTALVEAPLGKAVRSEYSYDKNFNRTGSSREIKDLFDDVRGVARAPRRVASQQITYDLLNRPTVEVHSAGGVTRTVRRRYNAAGGAIEIKTDDMTVSQTFDGFDRLTKTESAGVFTETSYDANGNVSYEFDSLGYGSSYGYDGLDRRVLVVDPLDTHFHMTFDAADNLVERRVEGITGKLDGSRRELQLIRFRMDEHNKTIEMTESSLNGGYGDVVTRFFYDAAGAVVRETVGRDSATVTTRDAIGRPLKVTDPIGNSISMTYSPDGLVTKLVEEEIERAWQPGKRSFSSEPKRYTTAFEYDLYGHLISKTQGMLRTRMCWDSAHNLRCERNNREGLREIRYDGLKRAVVMRRNGAESTLQYNNAGLITGITTPAGTETRQYDALGRMTQVTGAGGSVKTTFDEVGNPISVTDANGNTIRNTFGPSGIRLTSESGQGFERFRYDGLGRVVYAGSGALENITVEREYDGLGQLMADVQGYNGDVQRVSMKQGRDRTKTLSYPKIAGSLAVDFRMDAIGRIVDVDAGGLDDARYIYSGVGRLAGRYAGDQVSSLRYDAERRLVGKTLYNTILGEPKRWEGSLSYRGMNLASTSQTFYPVSSTYGANKVTSHAFRYDDAGRITQTDTVISSRQFVTRPWLHQSQVKYNRYDASGSLRKVATSFASIATEGFFSKEDVKRVSEVRLDVFERDAQRRVSNTATTILKPGAQIDNDAIGLPFDEIEGLIGNASDYTGFQDKTQPFRYDANGNLTEDEQFLYRYDFRNRLIQVDDKLARNWQREQTLFIRYDALGRPVAREFRSRHISRAAFDRKDARILYWQRQTIAELARAPWVSDDWKAIARYVPGASAGETLLMQRRQNDDLTADFKSYFIFEGLRGDIAYVAEPVGRLEQVLRTPHFTGEDAWTQGAREEPFIAGTTTRMPITGKGQRYDSFTRMTNFDGRPGSVVDYQAAPYLEYERYSSENFSALLDRIQKHHPKPEFLRNLEYGATGVMLLAMAPMLPVAAEGLLLMELEGLISVGVDMGLSYATGNKVTADGLASSFAMGAISGGIGRVAGGVSAMAGLSRAGQAVTSMAVDVTVGTALDVGVSGGDFSKALVGNVMSAGISAGLGAGFHAAKRVLPDAPARAPTRVAADQPTSGSRSAFVSPQMANSSGPLTTLTQYTQGSMGDVIKHIERLAGAGMPAAQQFVRDMKAGEFLFLPPSSVTKTLADRRRGYHRMSHQTRRTVVSLDPDLDAFGFHDKNIIANHPSQVLQLQAGMSPKMMAVTLLHEFSHGHGANELQAFHLSYDAMHRLGMLAPGQPGANSQMAQRARAHINALNAAHSPQAALNEMGRLRQEIIGDYMPKFWSTLAEANSKTDPNGWVSTMGAKPW